tara:strand:- start:3441 stop:4184 length:744 start_codon:yes stop_codon:yes gene_type:complete
MVTKYVDAVNTNHTSGRQVGGGAGTRTPFMQIGGQGHKNVTTRQAIEIAKSHLAQGNVLSESDMRQLHSAGVDITKFSSQFIPETGRSYHRGNCPNTCLWVDSTNSCECHPDIAPASQVELAIDDIIGGGGGIQAFPGRKYGNVEAEIAAEEAAKVAEAKGETRGFSDYIGGNIGGVLPATKTETTTRTETKKEDTSSMYDFLNSSSTKSSTSKRESNILDDFIMYSSKQPVRKDRATKPTFSFWEY